MVKDIMNEVKNNMILSENNITKNIKEHATLIEISKNDRSKNHSDSELTNLKDFVYESRE